MVNEKIDARVTRETRGKRAKMMVIIGIVGLIIFLLGVNSYQSESLLSNRQAMIFGQFSRSTKEHVVELFDDQFGGYIEKPTPMISPYVNRYIFLTNRGRLYVVQIQNSKLIRIQTYIPPKSMTF